MFFGILILFLAIAGVVFVANGGGGLGDWLGDVFFPDDPNLKGWECYNCHTHNPGLRQIGTQQQCKHCRLFTKF